MHRWNTAAWTAASVTALGVAIMFGPVAYGQTRAVQVEPARRVFEFAGGGSWIGASVRDLTDEDVSKFKLPAPGGAIVDEVTRDSPAATAGLKTGDVIVEFDGEKVRGTRHLTRLIQETPAGRKVQVSVMRDGQRVPLTVQPEASGRGASFGSFDLPDVARLWAMPAPTRAARRPAGPEWPGPARGPSPARAWLLRLRRADRARQ